MFYVRQKRNLKQLWSQVNDVTVPLHNQLDYLARHARFADRLESRAGFHDHSDRTLLRAVQIGNQVVPTASYCYLADSR